MNDVSDSDIRDARGLIRKRDLNGALRLLQKLLEADSENIEVLELLGTVHFLRKRPEEARSVFETLTITSPLHAPGWINLGAVLNQLGEHKRAAEALRRGLQRERNNAEAWFNLGIAQKALNLPSLAISAFREAVKHRPSMIDANLSLGTIYAEMNNHGMAQQCFNNALKQKPDSTKARALLEQSQNAQRQARRSQSPFGRLVDEEELAQRQDAAEPRKLNLVDRRTERELIRNVTKTFRQDAKGLPSLLTENVQQRLHQLQVAILQSEARIAHPEFHSEFVDTVNTLRELRTSVAAGIAELRNHIEPV